MSVQRAQGLQRGSGSARVGVWRSVAHLRAAGIGAGVAAARHRSGYFGEGGLLNCLAEASQNQDPSHDDHQEASRD